MLSKPILNEEELIASLKTNYNIATSNITFLPIGADINTIIYRVLAHNGANYFLKLRRGTFNTASILIPQLLAQGDSKNIISSLTNSSGELWTDFADYTIILYPYVEGHNGAERHLSEKQWFALGKTVKKLHALNPSSKAIEAIPKETFSTIWCSIVKDALASVDKRDISDPISQKMSLLLQKNKETLLDMIEQTEALAAALKQASLSSVICHADMHGWNMLINQNNIVHLIDWDTVILAPKERDLMFIGAGIHDTGRTYDEENALFYQGYGNVDINYKALAYYRFARIIEDISEYCQLIFSSDESDADRAQSLTYVAANFLPGGTIERAYNAFGKI